MQNVSARLFSALLLCCLFFSGAAQADAADAKTYLTMPFTITGAANQAHLKDALPQMLASRLYLKDQFQPATESVSGSAPADESAVAAAQSASNADYAIWGSVLFIGDPNNPNPNCSLEVKVRGANGQIWPHAVATDLNGLIPALERIAANINSEVFKRPSTQGAQTRADAAAPLSPELRVNEGVGGNSMLSPAIRMETAAAEMSATIMSQTLKFRSNSMVIADLNKDGVNEIVMVSDNNVYVYHWVNGRLDPKGEFKAANNIECVRVEAWDINNDGAMEIIVNAYDDEWNSPASFILSWRDGQLTMLKSRIQYYMSVVALPPTYKRGLVAQAGDSSRVFRPGVHEAIMRNGEIELLGQLRLPEHANVFNFAWLPASKAANISGDTDKIVMLGHVNERLQIYSTGGTRMAETNEAYSGGPAGIIEGSEMPGMGKGQYNTDSRYYVPMHMAIADLENDGTWAVLINYPVSTAATFFKDYRAFPQGEIQALFWDGAGLTLEWKTPRIKGSVVDLALVDLEGDGKLDLVINFNTHTGVTGTGQAKAAIRVIPLEAPNAVIH